MVLNDGMSAVLERITSALDTTLNAFEQGVVVVGRAKAWVEKDFSFDITGGVDFMNNVAQQVADYWQDIDQDTILVIKNYDGEDLGTFRRNLATYGAIKVRSYEKLYPPSVQARLLC